MRISLA
jgi:hypothetical protein